MFELIVYGYMKHLYSGRDIAEACKTDIYCIDCLYHLFLKPSLWGLVIWFDLVLGKVAHEVYKLLMLEYEKMRKNTWQCVGDMIK